MFCEISPVYAGNEKRRIGIWTTEHACFVVLEKTEVVVLTEESRFGATWAVVEMSAVQYDACWILFILVGLLTAKHWRVL